MSYIETATTVLMTVNLYLVWKALKRHEEVRSDRRELYLALKNLLACKIIVTGENLERLEKTMSDAKEAIANFERKAK
jgi:hypothetical protein